MAAKQDEQTKMAAVAAVINGESRRAVAKRIGVSESAVRKWCDNSPQFAQKCAQKKQEQAESILDYLDRRSGQVQRILDRLLDELETRDLSDATLAQLTKAFGTLVDKYAPRETETPADGEMGVVMIPEVRDDG